VCVLFALCVVSVCVCVCVRFMCECARVSGVAYALCVRCACVSMWSVFK